MMTITVGTALALDQGLTQLLAERLPVHISFNLALFADRQLKPIVEHYAQERDELIEKHGQYDAAAERYTVSRDQDPAAWAAFIKADGQLRAVEITIEPPVLSLADLDGANIQPPGQAILALLPILTEKAPG